MTTVFGNLTIEDAPGREVQPIKAVGRIGTVSTREISNGYLQVTVPIEYEKNGETRHFTARWNVRPEWFTREFTERVKSGGLTGTEKTQYDINFAGLTRSIFRATGLTGAFDFARLEGREVGFKTKVRKDRDMGDMREDIGGFFPPQRIAPPASVATPENFTVI